MSARGEPPLALDLAPPLHVPARFFATAALLGVAAGLLVAAEGPVALASRWSPSALAAVHLLALGSVAMVMLGAAQQMLPVVARAPLARPSLVATIVHLAWTAGAVLLPVALHAGGTRPALAAVAGGLLTLGAAAFALPAGLALARTRRGGDTVAAFRLAVLAFAIAVAFGAWLALGHAGRVPLERPVVTDLHAGWALAGWIGLLVMGAAWTVVPMLQGTPRYPAWLSRTAAPAVFALLVARTAAALAGGDGRAVARAAEIGACLVFVTFAVVTLGLQRRRVRTAGDPTVTCFRASMAAAIVACACHVVAPHAGAWGPRLGLAAAAAWIAGFAGCAIAGMLLRIAGFVGWLHLRRKADAAAAPGAPRRAVPDMKRLVPAPLARVAGWAQVAAAALATAAPAAPAPLGRAAGVAIAAASALLAAVLVRAAWSMRSA